MGLELVEVVFIFADNYDMGFPIFQFWTSNVDDVNQRSSYNLTEYFRPDIQFKTSLKIEIKNNSGNYLPIYWHYEKE
jgi:hypothetical protein